MPAEFGATRLSNREPYRGYALQAVDEKGRVAIPGSLRAALEKNAPADKNVVVGRHPRGPYLLVRDVAADAELHAKVQRRQEIAEDEGREFDPEAKSRISRVELAPYDTSGRFVIPPLYRHRAKIGKWAFFVGESDAFNIWSPEVLLAQPDLDEELREACEFHCVQRGVAL